LTELEINDMFQYWQRFGEDRPREAICQWVVDNLQDLTQIIPPTYPRTILEPQKHAHSNHQQPHDPTSHQQAAFFYATTTLGSLATCLVLVTAVLVHKYQHRRVLRYAQIEFLYLLLVGSAMVSVGAILMGWGATSDATCVAHVWLTGLGYTLELVPLLVKVAAINSLMQAARRMRRVQLQRSTLHGGVALIAMVVTAYLLTWTFLDPPYKTANYQLTDQTVTLVGPNTSTSSTLQQNVTTSTTDTDDNAAPDNNNNTNAGFEATIVQVQYYCQSTSSAWEFVAIGWNLILILVATALAFQSRSVKQDFNEARILSRLIYVHFLFIVLRVLSQFLEPSLAAPLLSLNYSLDTMCMLAVYFVPKFLADDEAGMVGRPSTYLSGVSGMMPSTASASGLGTSGHGHTGRPSVISGVESNYSASRGAWDNMRSTSNSLKINSKGFLAGDDNVSQASGGNNSNLSQASGGNNSQSCGAHESETQQKVESAAGSENHAEYKKQHSSDFFTKLLDDNASDASPSRDILGLDDMDAGNDGDAVLGDAPGEIDCVLNEDEVDQEQDVGEEAPINPDGFRDYKA